MNGLLDNLSKKTLLSGIAILILPLFLTAQVQKVKYFIKYNESTCLFDFCIIIKEGQATTMQQRVQMNAQYTVVVPAGSTVAMAAKYNPLQSNQQYNGTIPMDWQLGSTVLSPPAKPECDFYSIVPTLAPTSFYNNIYTNDTVRLFSLAISPVSQCGQGVRLFDNQNDPGPLAPGMNGSNFSNGFTIGGIQNRYDGNAASVLPRSPFITSLQGSCAQGLELHVEAVTGGAVCHGSITYEWRGPEDFFSDQPHVIMPEAGPLQKGMYYIKVQDSLGCIKTDSLQAFVKPDAGMDVMVACFQDDMATLHAKGAGVWTFSPENPGQAAFSNAQNPMTTVYGFSDPGEYMAIWTSSGCSDTVWIDVRQNCQCQTENTLEIPSVFSFCAAANGINLVGNEVIEQGSYRWIHSNNGSPFEIAEGNSSSADYVTGSLSPGLHAFRRIFIKSVEPICSDTSNVIFLEVSNSIEAGANIDLFCYSADTAFIQASGTGWWIIPPDNPGPLTISQFGNPVQQFENFAEPGLYKIIWTNEICSDTVQIFANPYCGCDIADGGEDKTACAGDTVIITGQCAIGTWRSLPVNPQGSSIVRDSAGVCSVVFQSNAAGAFFFEFVVFDTLTDTVKIIVHTLPVISTGEDFGYCEDSPAVLLVAGGGVQYAWSTGENTSNILVAPDVTTTYRVIGYDNNGCTGTDSITVSILPKPAGFIPPIPEVTEGSDVTLFAGQWTHGVTYIWNGPNGFTSVLQNPVLTNVNTQQAGLYTLTVISENDCYSLSSVYLTVNQSPLPVKVSAFNASYASGIQAVDIFWKVDFLVNHHFFIIEKAGRNENFKALVRVPGEANKQVYRISDTDILHGETYLYRLVSYDLDGKKQIFGPVEVRVGRPAEIDFQLFPVPAKDFLTLSVQSREDIQHLKLRVFNDTGKLVYEDEFRHPLPNNILQNLDISNIHSGLYRIVLFADNENHTLTMIKFE